MSSEYQKLSVIAKQLPGRPSTSSLWRWCRDGLKARNGEIVRVSHIRVGSRVMTRMEDCDRFFKEIERLDVEHFAAKQRRAEAPTMPDTTPTRTESQRDRDIAAAHQRLEAAGC